MSHFFFSDFCETKGSRTFFFCPSDEPRKCNVLHAEITQGEVRETCRHNDAGRQPFVQCSQGDKLRFAHSEDLQQVSLSDLDVCLSLEFLGNFVEDQLNPIKTATSVEPRKMAVRPHGQTMASVGSRSASPRWPHSPQPQSILGVRRCQTETAQAVAFFTLR